MVFSTLVLMQMSIWYHFFFLYLKDYLEIYYNAGLLVMIFFPDLYARSFFHCLI